MQPPPTIPVMPMRHAVVYPGIPTPLGVSRALSQRAIEAAQRNRGFLFAVTQRTPVADPTLDDLHRVGVVVRLLEVKAGEGDWEVLLQGVTRARVTSYHNEADHMVAVVEPMFDTLPDDPSDPTFVAVDRELRDRLRALGQIRGVPAAVLGEVLNTLADPGTLADFVASYIDLPTTAKQALLETSSVTERMNEALLQLQRQIEVERARDEIRGRVSEELTSRQRELYLREQLKVIRRELGDEDDGDVDALVARLEALELPERVRPEVSRECRRLRRAHPETGEAQVIRSYLEWIAELPWRARSAENLDLTEAARVLDEDHHGLQQVKDRVLEHLAVRALRAKQSAPTNGSRPARGPILLFQGPPGVGKTSVAASVARALGRSYVRVALGGVSDESDIRGHRRTYVGAMPGRIIDGIKTAGTQNPVFVLDEIDKLGHSWHGDPAHALLEVLDPSQNDSFTDHYLNVPFDLSDVLFIATANVLDTIPAPLMDRMELVTFEGYSENEKLAIAKRFLLPKCLRESGIVDAPGWSDDGLRAIIRGRTRESGVRQFDREIGSVLRKLARSFASGGSLPKQIGETEVGALLGRSRVRSEHPLEADEVGTATGMYYTPFGGDIMFVEAAIRPLAVPGKACLGEVSLVLTGHLGEVMRESARTAVTVAARRATMWFDSAALRGPIEAHVHVPAGAVPKDGPSAGLAMTVALVSAFGARAIRRDVAITGEITLSGRVLPVGGIEEKLLGAERAGIRHVILPRDNVDDLERLPEEVRRALQVHPVDDVEQALAVALVADG